VVVSNRFPPLFQRLTVKTVEPIRQFPVLAWDSSLKQGVNKMIPINHRWSTIVTTARKQPGTQ